MPPAVRWYLAIEMRFEAVAGPVAEQPQTIVEAKGFAQAAFCCPRGHRRAAAAVEQRLPQSRRKHIISPSCQLVASRVL